MRSAKRDGERGKEGASERERERGREREKELRPVSGRREGGRAAGPGP